jgi:hypothetical protein
MRGGAEAMFVGGPWHGRRERIAFQYGAMPDLYNVAEAPEVSFLASMEMMDPLSLSSYVTYRLAGSNDRPDDAPSLWIYLVRGRAELYGQRASAELNGLRSRGFYDSALADRYLERLDPQSLSSCVKPDCADRAPMVFVVREHGRLGGKEFAPQDRVHACAKHGHDIYLAQSAIGIDGLAEWLRPDAKLDTLDALDAAHSSLLADQIHTTRARGLRVRPPHKDGR